jgi:hypothetical protein
MLILLFEVRRDKPAWEKELEVLCIEGVAIHGGPEPCVGVRESVGEALVGGVGAGLLSREITTVTVPTLSRKAEGHVVGGVSASRWGTPRGRRTRARTQIFMRENREVPRSPVLVAGRERNVAAVSP